MSKVSVEYYSDLEDQSRERKIVAPFQADKTNLLGRETERPTLV
ncbi:hypothetical protein COLO4_14261 [Corchorus olitorius]|uniref:Uncharacterized protein n=1 Tax=Corchorus olitorius TaxID=93759 RepID=A0A1R3JSU0_9ROSI|nr:hypothetical protein COLO4_14261 [Corchorus olitorius]